MSSKGARHGWVRRLGGMTVFACCLLGAGCYTRQIEGLQSDLDNLDRKIHSLNAKKKDGIGEAGDSRLLQLEDQLNRITLQQAEMHDSLSGLRQDYSAPRGEIPSGSAGALGGSASGPDIKDLRRSLDENKKRTDQLAQEVDQLKITLNDLRGETRDIIGILKQEFAPEAAEEEAPAPGPVSKSSTQVEGPEAPAAPAPSAETSPVATVGKTYNVSPGETLSSIARKFGVTPETLLKINRMEDPRDLRMGQVLYLP